MLGALASKLLIVLFAYFTPAYQTFKALSRGDRDAQFDWCLYWCFLGFFLTIEWLMDLTIWWLPLYSESKLLCLICMWHPHVKGARYMFMRGIQPFLSRYENQIDSTLGEAYSRMTETFLGHSSRALGTLSANAENIVESMRSFSEGRASQRVVFEHDE